MHLLCHIFFVYSFYENKINLPTYLTKLEHHVFRGLVNDWFKSYLSDMKQFVSIKGHESNLAFVFYGVPQGSVLGLLLLLIYINDVKNQVIKFCKVHHLANDTNLPDYSKSITKLNKYINIDKIFWH